MKKRQLPEKRRARVGFIPLAIAILRSSEEPLTCQEIITKALAAGLLKKSGKTPVNTLSSLLMRHIKKQGVGANFKKIGTRYALNENGKKK